MKNKVEMQKQLVYYFEPKSSHLMSKKRDKKMRKKLKFFVDFENKRRKMPALTK